MYVTLYTPHILIVAFNSRRLVFDIPKWYVSCQWVLVFGDLPATILCLALAVGWILTLRKLGQIFQMSFFNVWNTVMTIIMCITWIVLFVLTCVAFWEGKIFISANEDTIQDGRHVNWRLRKHAEDVELGRRPDVEQPIDSGVHSVDLLIPTPETTIPDPKHITATLCTG